MLDHVAINALLRNLMDKSMHPHQAARFSVLPIVAGYYSSRSQ